MSLNNRARGAMLRDWLGGRAGVRLGEVIGGWGAGISRVICNSSDLSQAYLIPKAFNADVKGSL